MKSGDAHDGPTGVLNVHELMRLLPHRYPLLLVDRVTQCLPGKHIFGYKNVTRETCLGKTCLDNVEMPHLLIVEALAQISVVLALKSLKLNPTGRELMFFGGGIKNARFDGSVRPGIG